MTLTRNGLDRRVAVGLLGGLGAGTSGAFCCLVLGRLNGSGLLAVFGGEFLHATCGVQNLLLTSKEWVASAAQFDRDRL